jgi:hypothetical protein
MSSGAEGGAKSPYQDILDSGRPLLLARVAVDSIYERRRLVVEPLIAEEGIDMLWLMEVPIEDDSLELARSILGSEAPEASAWASWFQLKSTLDVAGPQRVFTNAAFADPAGEVVRQRLQADAFRGYGELMMDALDVLGPRSRVGGNAVRHAISQLTALALLNHPELTDTMAQISPGIMTFRQHVHAIMSYLPPDSRNLTATILRINAYTKNYLPASEAIKRQPVQRPDAAETSVVVRQQLASTPAPMLPSKAANVLKPKTIDIIGDTDMAYSSEEYRVAKLIAWSIEGTIRGKQVDELAVYAKKFRHLILKRAGIRV